MAAGDSQKEIVGESFFDKSISHISFTFIIFEHSINNKETTMSTIDEKTKTRLLDFTKNQTLNKTIESRRKIAGIEYIDIRRQLAIIMEEYGEGVDKEKIAKIELPFLLNSAKRNYPGLGDVLAIANVDVLFDEPYNFLHRDFIPEYSKDAILVLQSRYYISNNMVAMQNYKEVKENNYTIISGAYFSTVDDYFTELGPQV